MSSSKVDLKSINTKTKESQKDSSSGQSRDSEGKFTTGSGGLKRGGAISLKRALPLIIIVSMVGGALVYSSYAASGNRRFRPNSASNGQSAQDTNNATNKEDVVTAVRVKSNPNLASDIKTNPRKSAACAYVQSVYHGVAGSQRNHYGYMAGTLVPGGDPNTSSEYFKLAQQCGVVLPPSQACEYNRQRWVKEGYGDGLSDAQKMRLVIIGDFCQGKEFGTNDPNKKYNPNYELPEKFQSQYN